VFWDINFGKFWDYIVSKEFLDVGIAIIHFSLHVLVLNVCSTGIYNFYVRRLVFISFINSIFISS